MQGPESTLPGRKGRRGQTSILHGRTHFTNTIRKEGARKHGPHVHTNPHSWSSKSCAKASAQALAAAAAENVSRASSQVAELRAFLGEGEGYKASQRGNLKAALCSVLCTLSQTLTHSQKRYPT